MVSVTIDSRGIVQTETSTSDTFSIDVPIIIDNEPVYMISSGSISGQTPYWNGTKWVANTWSTQTTWYINSSTGSDSNTGSIDSPLASFSEFQKRLRGTILRTLYRVYITGNLDEMPVDFDIGQGGYLDIVFTVTTGATYTVATYTAANPASTLEVDKIETVEAASAAGLIGKRLRMTSGPASNLTFWATRALSGYGDDWFEMTKPVAWTYGFLWSKANPVAGNTFVVETLPIVASASFHIRRHAGQGFCFSVRNAQFGTLASPIQDPIFSVEGWGYSVSCAWYTNGFQTDGYHVGDGFLKGSVIRGLATPIDKARFICCYLNGNYLLSDVVIWDSLFKHGFVGIESGEVHFIGLVGIMCEVADAIQDACFVYSSACRLLISTNGEPDGYCLIMNQTRYGFNIPPGAVVNYATKPVVLVGGAAKFALVGATARDAAVDVPYIEPASNAAIIAGMNGALGD
jgi:hypothetical protein